MAAEYVNLDKVLDFVTRTVDHGVPLRVATRRAERRFGIDRKVVKFFVLATR